MNARNAGMSFNLLGSFSGCGGSSLGYQQAGFDVRAAIEFDPAASNIYSMNHRSPILSLDIREVTPEMVYEKAGLEPGQLDVFEGSPPCSKFSLAGKREKGWNKVSQSDSLLKQENVEDLFDDWLRLAGQLRPKIAVAENVIGLTVGKAKGKLRQILRTMRAIGYETVVLSLEASDYGVQQRRQSIFIIGVDRNRLPHGPLLLPEPVLPRLTVGDAFQGLTTETVKSSLTKVLMVEQAPALAKTSLRIWWETPANGYHPRFFNNVRLSPTCPAPTLCASTRGMYAHWSEPRRLSVREMARIQGFPDTYDWGPNTWGTIAGRIGNSVPPPLAKAVGQQLIKVLQANGH